MARGDETAIVTGATSGLGAQFAEQLALRGFGLALVARNVARLKDVQANLISRYALPVEILQADLVTDEQNRRGRVTHRPQTAESAREQRRFRIEGAVRQSKH
ncbi:SDR family NAD(P)-dependent oxidoreductase [Paramicrobacterium agarici]|uniref:SDR family NAD(P)-dependent oxidoreductase n=1 Tax=Paramicrobacterium agarici TaxID=630514 RepID=UPI00319E0F46